MSWWELDTIIKEQAGYENFFRTVPPMACPNDGEPLVPGPAREPAVLYCRFDGWTYPRDWDPQIHSGM